jgi:hypothetical protein
MPALLRADNKRDPFSMDCIVELQEVDMVLDNADRKGN